MGKLAHYQKALENFGRFAEKGYSTLWNHGGTLGKSRSIDKSRLGSATGTPASKEAFFLTSNTNAAEGFAKNAGGEVTQLFMKDGYPAIDWQEHFPGVPLRSNNGQRALSGMLQDIKESYPDVPAIQIKNANDSLDDAESVADILAVFDTSKLRHPEAKLEDLEADDLYASVGGLAPYVGGAAVLGGAMAPEEAEAAYQQEQYGQAVKGAASRFLQKRQKRRGMGSNPEVGAASRRQMLAAIPEFVAGINKGVADTADFVGSQVPNAVLELMGSDQRVNSLYDVPGVSQATQGGFMEPGKDREAIYNAGQLISPL